MSKKVKGINESEKKGYKVIENPSREEYEEVEIKCLNCGNPLYYEDFYCNGTDLEIYAVCHICGKHYKLVMSWD